MPSCHQEWLKSLKTIDRQVPKDLHILLILDDCATHRHEDFRSWLEKHPRFHLHFTPTSSSWLNLVERWFRELTDKALRRGVFHSVPDLIASIQEYIDTHNDGPKPYVWTATAESILAKVARGRIALENVGRLRGTPLASAASTFGEVEKRCSPMTFATTNLALYPSHARLPA